MCHQPAINIDEGQTCPIDPSACQRQRAGVALGVIAWVALWTRRIQWTGATEVGNRRTGLPLKSTAPSSQSTKPHPQGGFEVRRDGWQFRIAFEQRLPAGKLLYRTYSAGRQPPTGMDGFGSHAGCPRRCTRHLTWHSHLFLPKWIAYIFKLIGRFGVTQC